MVVRSLIAAVALVAAAAPATAQSLGTLTWQLQPYCNVVTVNVTGTAGVYTLEGYDDQCGAPTRAPLTGVATPNPDGSIGFGFTVITSPGGRGVQVEARISMAGLSGPWTDSDGHKGTFAFNAKTGGSPRPLPPPTPPVIPPTISLRTDGGFVATGAAGTGTIPATGSGIRMMWHPGKAAFRAGAPTPTSWNDDVTGVASAAFGSGTTASGSYSLATGFFTQATGSGAVASGYDTVSAGLGSFATGLRTRANGNQSFAGGADSAANGANSFAFGNALAAGDGSVAIGTSLDAAGEGSIALGSYVTTTAAGRGSFVFGDRSTTTQFFGFQPNQFRVRAVGGTFFFSNSILTAGVVLGAGANAWSSLSDVNSKEHFRDLDGAELLGKLTAMPIREWSYKSQDAAIRHVGPTAQDFHAAFGLGEDPLRISTIDADGIALAGVRALAIENAALKAELAGLRADLSRIERDLNRR